MTRNNSNSFTGKVFIITGAGKGLGKAYALYLAQHGASIVVNNRKHGTNTQRSADETVAEIKAKGGFAIADYCDVEDPESGEKLLALALEHFSRVDGLIANAAISEGRSFHNQSLAEFTKVININVMGTAAVVRPIFKYMYAQQHGSIILSTSVAGLYGEHGLPAYSSSKAAIIGLMRALHLEGRSHNIRVNALSPFAATQMTEKNLDEHLKTQLSADKVAPVAAWLLSEGCKLSGETIITGGGKTSRAKMLETDGIIIPNIETSDLKHIADQWQTLQTQTFKTNHENAIKQFQTFIRPFLIDN